jgi:hypothetical protein
MVEEKVLCAACGVPILGATAETNDGLCIPCRRGHRSRLETSKAHRAREAKYRKSPQGKHWQRLVTSVAEAPAGFESLSPANQKFFAVGTLLGETYNGGLEQYFFNRAADHYAYALQGLLEMGAAKTLRLTVEAKEILFGKKRMPSTCEGRRARLRSVTDDKRTQLNSIDKLFWEDPDKIAGRMDQFAKRYALWTDA